MEEKTETTIMAVRRSALKNFKLQATKLGLSMIELHDRLSKIPVSKLKELIK